MGDILRRTFIVGDLVTVAPDFRNTVLDFDFERYIGIITNVPDDNEYIVYWTSAPNNNYYKGMWSGDHLVKIEDYDIEKEKTEFNLQYIEIWVILVKHGTNYGYADYKSYSGKLN